MTSNDQSDGGKGLQDRSAAALSAAATTAQQALDSARGTAQQAVESAKDIVSQAHLDEVGAKAASAAANLDRGGRDRLAGNEELSQATEQLSGAIRQNPLRRGWNCVFRRAPARSVGSRLAAMGSLVAGIARQQVEGAIAAREGLGIGEVS